MKALIWSKENCTFCVQAIALLNKNNIEFEERKIGQGYTREDLLAEIPFARSVPQIFIDQQHIGGFTELKKYFEERNKQNEI